MSALADCMAKLSSADRELISGYYTSTPAIPKRRELAERMGVSMNTLRIRAHRLRQKLAECVRRLETSEMDSPVGSPRVRTKP